jgi:hypothetical protein
MPPRTCNVKLSTAAQRRAASSSAATGGSKPPGDSPAEEVPNADSVAPPVCEERVELPQELAVLLDREGLPKVRRTPTGEYSLADIGMAITGKNANHAAEDLRIVMSRFPEVTVGLSDYKFSGRGHRTPTPVGNLAKVVEYIMLLPGKTAARVRVKAATILVRYLGGDLRLIDEVKQMRRVQQHLAEADPDNWRHDFGKAVETDAAVAPKEAEEDPGAATKRRRLVDLEKAKIEEADTKTMQEAARVKDKDCTRLLLRDVLQKHMTSPCDTRSVQYAMLLRKAACTFLYMITCEYPDHSEQALRRTYTYDVSGRKITVPEDDVHLAEAAVLHALSVTLHGGSDAWVPPHQYCGNGGDSETPRRRGASSAGFSARAPEHAHAKDGSNCLWISLVEQSFPGSLGDVFYLDDFQGVAGGHALRTTEALLQRGFAVERLHCANPNPAVVLALQRRGVRHVFQGTWTDAPWEHKAFVGIYLDLCTGSAGYATEQIEVACDRAASGCILAHTLVDRNYEGEDLLLRHNRLVDLLFARGWRPACHGSFSASTRLHRSSGGQRVLTQVWRKYGLN